MSLLFESFTVGFCCKRTMISSSHNGMSFPRAAQPDIVRAHQKDEGYRSQSFDACQDAVRRVVGPRRAILWNREIELASDVLYRVLTTGFGQQTLGEEYCDILQTAGPAGGTAPSLPRRAASVVLEALAPYLEEQLQGHYGSADHLAVRRGDPPLQNIAKTVAACMPWAMRVHLALFYLFGIYYEIPKRVTGTRYLFHGKIIESRPSYHLLGILMFVQLATTAGLWALPQSLALLRGTRPTSAHDHQGAFEQAQVAAVLEEHGPLPAAAPDSMHRCPLCLSARDIPTATLCGHVFCWSCISAWSNQKPECPLCRAPCTGSELVRVHHADF